MSPIDMESQERIKLERKRQRNRIAASKCRRRKLEKIAKLEDKVKLLKNDNSELATVVVKLRQQVCGLKEQVMEHVNCGCQIMLANQFWLATNDFYESFPNSSCGLASWKRFNNYFTSGSVEEINIPNHNLYISLKNALFE